MDTMDFMRNLMAGGGVILASLLAAGLLIPLGLKSGHVCVEILSHLGLHFQKSRPNQREHRRASRVPCNFTLELLDKTDRVTLNAGRLVNLSSSGACLSSTAPLKPGIWITGRLQTEQEGVLKVHGQVVWQRRTAGHTLYGIQFYSTTKI